MWKWIVGGLLVLVLIIGGTCYAAIRKVTAGGDTAIVTVSADIEHVFSALSDADSMQVWMMSGSHVSPLGHGQLQVGDTLQIASTAGDSTQESQQQLWVVREMSRPNLLAFDAIHVDSAGAVRVMFSRRDSLVSMGDSTTIYSAFAMGQMLTGDDTAMESSGKAVPGMVQKLAVSAFRLFGEAQLNSLKQHLAKP